MASTYRPRVLAPPDRWLRGEAAELTVEALRASVTDAAIRDLSGPLTQEYPLEFGMQRETHASALDEIADWLARFGFTFANALISEWVRQTVRGAVAGILTAGGGTALKTRNADATAAAAGIGLIAGGIAGSFVHEEIARYVAQRDPWSGIWRVSAVQLPKPAEFRFGYA